jgi:transmembrane sensor
MSALRIEEEAARWLMRRDEPDWSPADQAALDAWLDDSMAHTAAYWRLEHGWNAAGRLAATSRGFPAYGTGRSRLRSGLLAIAASLLLAIGLAAVVFRTASVAEDRHAQQFATHVGERRAVSLADGSRVELNTKTRLRAAIAGTARELWLDEGEAYFDVVHDPRRPFVVHAGARTITVLGTKFSVRLDRGRLQVAVSEGRVRIDRPAAAGRSMTIMRGDLAVAEGPSLLVAENSPARVENNLSWRRGMLTFEQSSLADVASEFNRYNRRRVVIADTGAASIRIGGTFEAGNVEAFGRLLRDAYGLNVQFMPDEIRISS